MSYRPITDIWMLARPKVNYYGAYPNGFLERARALLGVSPYDPVLHVCGGMAREYPQKPRGFGPNDMTLDLDPALNPDYVGPATVIPLRQPHAFDDQDQCTRCMMFRKEDPGNECLENIRWGAIIADPPYTPEDATHYRANATKAAVAAVDMKALRAALIEGDDAAVAAIVAKHSAKSPVSNFPSPNAILKAMLTAVEPGRRVGMLHYVLPAPPSEKIMKTRFVACVGVIVGFNNRMRCFSVFEKE